MEAMKAIEYKDNWFFNMKTVDKPYLVVDDNVYTEIMDFFESVIGKYFSFYTVEKESQTLSLEVEAELPGCAARELTRLFPNCDFEVTNGSIWVDIPVEV